MDNIFEGLMGIIAVSGLFGWIPVMVWWKHRIRLEEIRNQQGAGVTEATISTLREVQRELRELRETTAKFDLSFDAGLDRLEERVNRVEGRTINSPVYRNGAAASVDEPQTVLMGNQGR
ncbi:MAG: hypothetical protein H7145_11125 [Akkermansiaceae bacterium]|nr:hypothetical protein [Armatimonadota bacterium]